MGFGPVDQLLNPHSCLLTTAVHRHSTTVNIEVIDIDQLREVLRLPSIKDIGGERQLRLVVNWMDSEVAAVTQITAVDQLDSLLPLVDLQSITDDILFNFIGENHAMLANHQYR